MKNLIAAAVLALATTGAAQAATVTIYYEATNLYGDAEAFAALGINPGDSLTGSFTYDDTLPSSRGTIDSSHYKYEDGSDAHSTSTISVNGTDYAGSAGDNVYSRDGIADGTTDINDAFLSYTYDAFNDLSGVSDSYGYVEVYDYDETLWSGLGRTATELNDAATKDFYQRLTLDSGGYAYLYSDNVTFSASMPAVPLPAGGLLLVSGLAGIGLLRRKRAA